MGQSQDGADTARERDARDLFIRYVAPGVYFGPDGILTADSLDSAIAYLQELADPAI
jgi:hypothetical protein